MCIVFMLTIFVWKFVDCNKSANKSVIGVYKLVDANIL